MDTREMRFRDLMKDVVFREELPQVTSLVERPQNDSVDRLLPEIRNFLIFVARKHLLRITDYYRECRMGMTKGNRIKNLACKLGLLEEAKVQLDRGRGKGINTLCVTDKGYDFLNLKRTGNGKGGPLHRDFQEEGIYRLKDMRVKADVEYFLNGKLADIGFELRRRLWAVEVTLRAGKNEKENLLKDLEAGFDTVVFLCKDCQILEEIKKNLSCYLSDTNSQKILFCLFEEFFAHVEIEMEKITNNGNQKYET